MEENPNGQRYGIIDSQLIENVSNILGFDTGRHNSTQNSEYWKAKFEEADGTLQSCEKNKKVVEKQNEDLKNENKQTQKAVDDAKMAMAKLCARNEILEDLHKKSEEERNDQCQKITQLEKELTLQKEIVEKMERKLNESQDTVKKETVLRKNLEIVNEKTSLKADALEKYVETLIDIKQLYETRIRNSDTVIAKKENEVKEVTEKHFVQTQKFEELEHDAEKLQNDIQVIHNKFESCCKERDTTEMKFNELREVYVTNSDKLSDECYSLNVSLQRAYNDCEVYCKRIEELEGTLEGLHDTRSLQVEEIDILKTQMNDKDDQISKFKKQESDLKDRQSELEIQSVDHKEEIRKLREMFDVEKAKNETLEHMCGQKVSDYEDYVSKFKDLGSRLQMLETRLKEEKETHSTTLEVKEMLLCENKELQQKLKILEDDCDKNEKKVNDLTRSLILAQDENAKLKKAVEETSEDASKQTNNCQELTAKNQCLSAVNEENEQEIAALKSHLEKLKSQLWTLRERSIEMAAAADVIEKFKERCYVLIEEKNELLAELERLKVDRCRLTRVNEEQREAIWKARQGQSVSQSRIKDLETAVSELREGKEMALQKGTSKSISLSNSIKLLQSKYRLFALKSLFALRNCCIFR